MKCTATYNNNKRTYVDFIILISIDADSKYLSYELPVPTTLFTPLSMDPRFHPPYHHINLEYYLINFKTKNNRMLLLVSKQQLDIQLNQTQSNDIPHYISFLGNRDDKDHF